MAEHSAVNRRVVGSSPTCGAILEHCVSEPQHLVQAKLVKPSGDVAVALAFGV